MNANHINERGGRYDIVSFLIILCEALEALSLGFHLPGAGEATLLVSPCPGPRLWSKGKKHSLSLSSCV